MKLFKSKKAVAVGLAAGLALGLSGVAFSYWTSTGSGSGSASTGTSAATLSVVGTASTTLTVGNSSPVSFTAANGSNFAQQISSIDLTNVKAYDTAAHATLNDGTTGIVAGCGMTTNTHAADVSTASSGEPDFWMPVVTVPVTDGNIAANATAQVLATGGTLHMNNLAGQDQAACKSAFLALTFAVS